MPAIVKCNCCERTATARIIEDSPEINYMEVEPNWRDNEVEWDTVKIDGQTYWFDNDDPECRLFLGLPCEHEDYEIIEIESDYDYD